MNTLSQPNNENLIRPSAWWTNTDADVQVDAAGLPIPGPDPRFWRGVGLAAVLGLGIYALAVLALWAVLRWL